MATTGPMNDMPRFAKARLQQLAEAISTSTAPGDPLAEAAQLRLRALRWADAASRRAALALRIALLSRPMVHAPALVEPPPPPEPEAIPEHAPDPSPPPAKSRSPRPERPGLAIKDATSLLAALSTSSDESWSNPDQTGTGRGMDMSMPDMGSIGGPDLPDGLPETDRPQRVTPPAPPAPITMTDLSLSILTGEFRPSPPPLQIDFPEEPTESEDAAADAPDHVSTAHRQEASRILSDDTEQAPEPKAAPRPSGAKPGKRKPAAAKRRTKGKAAQES